MNKAAGAAMPPIPTAPTMFRVYYKESGLQCFHGHDSLKRARIDAVNLKLKKQDDVKIIRCQDGAEIEI